MTERRGAGLGDGSHPGAEALEPERVDVDPAADGGIGGVEQLEAAVDQEPVDAVGPDAAADGVTRLEHEHLVPGLAHHLRAAQPGQPSPDDQHVCVHAATLVVSHPLVRRLPRSAARDAAAALTSST